MSQEAVIITLYCDADIEEFFENALNNSGLQIITKVNPKKPKDAYIFHIPLVLPWIFQVLHILEAKKDVIKGSIEFPDGTKYELTQEGIAQLNDKLIEAMSKKRENVAQPITWWTPFVPEIKVFLLKITEFIDWYPKAASKGKRDVTLGFGVLLGLIILSMWVLTIYGKVSGDAFVFVIGAVIGYIFAFLQRFLGIFGD